MANNLDALLHLRPDAQFSDAVNPYSIETLAETYIGTMPTQAEINQAKIDADALQIQREQERIDRQNRLKERKPVLTLPEITSLLYNLLDENNLRN